MTFDNNAPRLDVTGTIMDAHDGRVQFYNGLYYLYAVEYGLCVEPYPTGCVQTSDKCGFRLDHNISIWTSPTLASGSWTFQAYAFPWIERPAGTLFRPDVVYNQKTKQYVLWWNWVASNGTYMGYAAATSASPAGPFVLKTAQTNLTRNNATFHAGDGHIFVDPKDQKAYFIYGANYYMGLEELTSDYLASTGKSVMFSEYFIESPFMFVRQNVYYALFGHCCCFCFQGSGVIVHTAPTPMGPWKTQGDVACRTGLKSQTSTTTLLGMQPTPGQGCLYNGSTDVSVTRSQQNFVVEVGAPGNETFLWVGDRWSQAPDGLKGHDPTYVAPLVFGEDGSIETMKWVDSFTVDMLAF